MHRAFSRTLLLTLCCLALAPRAKAGALEASEAFKKGDYAGVLSACEGAAKSGDASCEDFMGLLYSEGLGVKKDAVQAAHWFRLSAEQGNAVAALNLGLAYETGAGVGKDLAQAEKWYALAAGKGLAPAQTRLALLLIGSGKDLKNGIKLLRQAAAQAEPVAEGMLGIAYQAGTGVHRNPRLALKWLAESADQGFPPAQSALAGIYERGEGTDIDFKEAYFWYAVALRDPKDGQRKDDEAGLKRVAAKLSKRDLDEAAAIAADWKPTEPGTGAGRRSAKRKSAPQEAEKGPHIAATGSGFYVTRSGYLITNNQPSSSAPSRRGSVRISSSSVFRCRNS